MSKKESSLLIIISETRRSVNLSTEERGAARYALRAKVNICCKSVYKPNVSHNHITEMALEPRWPPRSPHEALLSSPSGRRRLRQYQDRTSPSPSPMKKRPAMTEEEEDEDCEDEETLQLRLETLEARLKLKKLQQKKKLKAASKSFDKEGPTGSRLVSNDSVLAKDWKNSTKERMESLGIGVEVPVSPPRKRAPAQEVRSPGRVLLGIDKGLTGKNISLRSYPNAQARVEADADPFTSTARRGAPRETILPSSRRYLQEEHTSRPKTFSERIAETRQKDNDDRARQNRLQKQRSTGFGIEQLELETLRDAAASTATNSGKPGLRPMRDRGFSRTEVLKSLNKTSGNVFYKSRIISSGHSNGHRDPLSSNAPASFRSTSTNYNDAGDASRPSQKVLRSTSPSTQIARSHSPIAEDPALFDPFSRTHLCKRHLPHPFLSKTLGRKHISLIPELLATIKSPDYTLPETLENDFVVFGIIASKSSPLSHKKNHRSTSEGTTSLQEATDSEMNAQGKYMVFTLTDLKWSIDFYIFTTAYTRFWKLTPGTLIAILNPSIMPPPPGKADTGRFSLVLNSGDDTILEIGTSQNLGWCKSIKKDGKPCGSWVDKKHTEYCEWHIDRVVESTRRGRMEVNGMSAPYAPGGKTGGRTGFWGTGKISEKKEENGNKLLKEGPQWDRGTSSTYFINPMGRSAAALIDADSGGPMERGGSKEERVRKRLAERAREREIARKLGEGGNGIGKEYLRLRAAEVGKTTLSTTSRSTTTLQGSSSNSKQNLPPVDASSLGLLGNKATDVQLSPVKKNFGQSLKRKIPAAAVLDDDAEQGGNPRSRKKTRFVTEKGIREAGRESLGLGDGDEDGDDRQDSTTRPAKTDAGPERVVNDLHDNDNDDDNDDDELDIV